MKQATGIRLAVVIGAVATIAIGIGLVALWWRHNGHPPPLYLTGVLVKAAISGKVVAKGLLLVAVVAVLAARALNPRRRRRPVTGPAGDPTGDPAGPVSG